MDRRPSGDNSDKGSRPNANHHSFHDLGYCVKKSFSSMYSCGSLLEVVLDKL
jgi:hypothetical protein